MKVKFYTLGCKVNQYETQAIMEEFIKNGYQIVAKNDADLYIVNTCTVTKRADNKSIRLIKHIKKINPYSKIAAIGCLAELNSNILERLNVDYIIPQDKKHLVFDIISSYNSDKKNIWSLKISRFFNQRAFVKIQDGCNFKCSFCKIPFVRGKSISREKSDILEEIKRLLDNNHKEIVLCGINLGLYGKDLTPKYTIEDLIEDILKINLNFRIRLSSIEPIFITERLISFFKEPKICPHIHLPFQSGDDYILEKMNKKERVSLYKDVVKKLRSINKDIAISCDIMVGFPYETDDTFKNTVSFLEEIKPMRIHIFTFSPRENTEFFNYKVKDNKIFVRYNILKKLKDKLELEYKTKFLKKRLYMLAEEKKNSYTIGYTENYIRVMVKDTLKLGEIFAVEVSDIKKDKVFCKSLE